MCIVFLVCVDTNCILFTIVVRNISQLDPEKARTTLEVIKQQEKPKVTTEEQRTVTLEEQRTVTIDELREKLHKRIELLRSKRHADTAASTAKSAKDWQTEKKRDRKSKDPEEDGLKAPSAKRPKLQAKAAMVYLHCLVCSSLACGPY